MYKRENTKSETAPSCEIKLVTDTPEPSKTDRVDTTLSFAINPVISAVDMRQSPKPSGLNIGAIKPAIVARILSCELVTMLNLMSNVCKNHIIIVATNITVKALCKKSFALSQRSWHTLFELGIL